MGSPPRTLAAIEAALTILKRSSAFDVTYEGGADILDCHRLSFIGINYIKQSEVRRNDSATLVQRHRELDPRKER